MSTWRIISTVRSAKRSYVEDLAPRAAAAAAALASSSAAFVRCTRKGSVRVAAVAALGAQSQCFASLLACRRRRRSIPNQEGSSLTSCINRCFCWLASRTHGVELVWNGRQTEAKRPIQGNRCSGRRSTSPTKHDEGDLRLQVLSCRFGKARTTHQSCVPAVPKEDGLSLNARFSLT